MSTYISPAPNGETSKVILFLTDVIGHKFVNAQLLADAYASRGYFVVMPDLFHDDPWVLNPPEGATLQSWFVNHLPDTVQPTVDATLKQIKEEIKPKFIGAVGYCFGGKYVTRLLAGQIDAGYIAHPSLVDMDELAAVTKPLAIAAAGEF